MDYNNKYIPREYLALKINYCKRQLEELPEVKIYKHTVKGGVKKRIIIGSHKYDIDSPKAIECNRILAQREELISELQIYEAIWNANFKGEPPADCKPGMIKRYVTLATGEQVLMNRAFFDSLQNDDNKKFEKFKSNFFNGTYYRSAAERDIAAFYTDMGIEFKYEPSILLLGLAKPINPDFVLYLRELDTCKIHEHLGMKDSAEYLKITKIKYGNYTGAGLIPGTDILFTHDLDDAPFDVRSLSANLNNAVYSTITWNGA